MHITVLRLSACVLLFGVNVSFAQSGLPQKVRSNGGANCERVAAIVDSFVQGTPSATNIIVIAYKGSSETRKGLTSQRIKSLRSYFTHGMEDTAYARPPGSVIFGVSDESASEGRLDLYVDGVLGLQILFEKNSRLALSPCYAGTPRPSIKNIKRETRPECN